MQKPISLNRSMNDNYSDDDMGIDFLANTNRTGNNSNLQTPQRNPLPAQPQQSFSSLQFPMNDNNNNNMPPPINQPPPPNVNINKMDHQSSAAPSEYSQGSRSFDDSVSEMTEHHMSEQEVQKEKRTLLFKLKRYEKKGYKLSHTYSMHSTLEDLRSEYESIRREANLEQGLQVSKNMLISTCSLLEYMNNRFDPMDIVLDGWSEEVHEDVEEGKYDEVLEELYYKYYDKVSIGPELKLLTMLGGSAVKFHMTQTLLKTMVPDAETLLKQNPNLKNDIANLINKSGANPVQNLNQQVNNMMFNGQVSGLGVPKHKMKDPDDVAQILRDIERNADAQSDVSDESKKRKSKVLEMSI